MSDVETEKDIDYRLVDNYLKELVRIVNRESILDTSIENFTRFSDDTCLKRITAKFGTDSTNTPFARMQLHNIEEEISACVTKDSLKAKLDSAITSLQVNIIQSIKQARMYNNSISNDVSLLKLLYRSYSSGNINKNNEDLIYNHLKDLSIPFDDSYYRDMPIPERDFFRDYVNSNRQIDIDVPKNLFDEEYQYKFTSRIVSEALNNPSRIKNIFQSKMVSELKEFYDLLYIRNQGDFEVTLEAVKRTFVEEYKIYSTTLKIGNNSYFLRFWICSPIIDAQGFFPQLTYNDDSDYRSFFSLLIQDQSRDVVPNKSRGFYHFNILNEIKLVEGQPDNFPYIAETSAEINRIIGDRTPTNLSSHSSYKELIDVFKVLLNKVGISSLHSDIHQLFDLRDESVNGVLLDFMDKVYAGNFTENDLCETLDKFCDSMEIDYVTRNRNPS